MMRTGLMAALALAACGNPRHSTRDRNPSLEETDDDRRTTLVKTDVESVALSADGKFQITFAPGSFDQEVRVIVDVLTGAPESRQLVSKLYRARYSPAEAVFFDNNRSLSLGFTLSSSAVEAAGGSVEIGVLPEAAADFSASLPAVWSAAKNLWTASTTSFGAYAALAPPADGCSVGQWSCSNGTCIVGTGRCNGAFECADGSDEEDCQDESCDDTEWQCAGGQCIASELLCDGTTECPDSSDEQDCGGGGTCGASQWACDNGECIPDYYECEGITDCSDGSDEDSHCDGDPDAFEPDGTFAEARAIAAGENQSHSLGSSSDKDYVTFTVSTWSSVTGEITIPAGGYQYLYMTLYDAAQTSVGSGDSYYGDLQAVIGPGTYYLLVYGYSKVESYTLKITALETEQPVLAPKNVKATAVNGKVLVSWDASELATGYKVKYYTYTSGATPAQEGASPLTTADRNQTLTGLQSGTYYYFSVAAFDATRESAYSGEVSLYTPLVADAYEDDDTFETAKAIPIGQYQTRSLDTAQDLDFASFSLDSNKTVLVTMSHTGYASDYTLRVYDEAKVQRGTTGSTSVSVALGSGNYYIRVAADGYSYTSPLASYTLMVGVSAQ